MWLYAYFSVTLSRCVRVCMCTFACSCACLCMRVSTMHILDSEIQRFFPRYIMYVSSEIGELTLERLAWLNVWVVSSLSVFAPVVFCRNLYHIGITYIYTHLFYRFLFSRALNGSFLVLGIFDFGFFYFYFDC